jgi:hypothetical protein
MTGRAAGYLLRYRTGEPIETLRDWDEATPLEEELPVPAPAGTTERYRIEGLRPGGTYGFALRAADAIGQLSPWVGGILLTVPQSPLPPLPVEDLSVVAVGLTSVTLRWSHPADPATKEGPAFFEVGLSTEMITQNNFDATAKHPDPPDPAGAGELVSVVWEDLDPQTSYWVAVRVRGSKGLSSPLSEVVGFATLEPDAAPPDPPGELRIVGKDLQGDLILTWDPSPSLDIDGYLLYGQNELGEWTRLSSETIPAAQTEVTAQPCCPAYALSAIDQAGNESALGPPVRLGSETFLLKGPYPHPVPGVCRVEIQHPFSWDVERVRARIYSVSGRLVRTLYDGPPSATGQIGLVWDRTDDGGRPTGPGFHLLLVQAGKHRIERKIFLLP